jgi:hypothetical protein
VLVIEAPVGDDRGFLIDPDAGFIQEPEAGSKESVAIREKLFLSFKDRYRARNQRDEVGRDALPE